LISIARCFAGTVIEERAISKIWGGKVILLPAYQRFFHGVFFVLFRVAFALVEFRDVVDYDAVGGVDLVGAF
jgi:hypothetical protein